MRGLDSDAATCGLIAMPMLQGCPTEPSAKASPAWPLLVQDPGLTPNAGEFLTRCRWCDWNGPRASTPDEALAAFAAHACQERPS
jgi:hypothetical protein